MSIPKIGIEDEAIGIFECEILNPDLENEENLIFKADMNSFKLENKYYEKLYQESTIDLILSVDCFNVYKELKTSIKEKQYVEFPRKDAGGKFVISIYFIATKDFILDTRNENFNSFYNEEYKISKGQIVSKVITRHVDIDLTSTSSSFKFLTVNKNPDIEDDFEIKLEDEFPELSIKSEDTFFDYDTLRSSSRLKGINKITDAILLGPLFIELIRIIIEDRLEGEKYEWAEVMAKKMGFNSLDELTNEIQDNDISQADSFQTAYNLYSSRLHSENHFKELFEIIKTI